MKTIYKFYNYKFYNFKQFFFNIKSQLQFQTLKFFEFKI